MASTINNEEVLCSINSYKNINSSTKIVNFFANLFSAGIAGRVANDFKLILTPENLYIQAIGRDTWGGLTEVLHTEKILRKDIKTFEVKTEQDNEFIEIATIDNKEMSLIRDNEKNDNLASIMASLILDN